MMAAPPFAGDGSRGAPDGGMGGGVEKVQGAAVSPGADDRKMAPALLASGEFLHFLTDYHSQSSLRVALYP